MVSRLNPYLTFHGNAREAMEFYHSVFGGELTVDTFGEYGGAPDGLSEDGVMHALLKTDSGFVLMASDAPGEAPGDAPGDASGGASGGAAAEPGGSIAVSLSGTDPELRDYWQKLSADGTVTMPFEKQMWGDEFGMCVDRFGVPWMVDIGTGD